MIWSATTSRRTAAARAGSCGLPLKDGIDGSEYIFASYAGHVGGAIFLGGLPDTPTSLPHFSPRTR